MNNNILCNQIKNRFLTENGFSFFELCTLVQYDIYSRKNLKSKAMKKKKNFLAVFHLILHSPDADEETKKLLYFLLKNTDSLSKDFCAILEVSEKMSVEKIDSIHDHLSRVASKKEGGTNINQFLQLIGSRRTLYSYWWKYNGTEALKICFAYYGGALETILNYSAIQAELLEEIPEASECFKRVIEESGSKADSWKKY